MWVGSRDGRHFDASFVINQHVSLVILYEAAGGTADHARNTEYSKGLIEILLRLGELGAPSWKSMSSRASHSCSPLSSGEFG